MLKKMDDHQVKTDQAVEAAGSGKIVGRLRQSIARGLSGRLLVLTILFVMIAEVLIFVPSVGNFRNVWLQNHLDTAEAASIVYLDESTTMLSSKAQQELLWATEALSVSISEGDATRLMASMPTENQVVEHIKLGGMQPIETLRSTLSTMFFGGDRTYRVSGPMKSRGATIHLVQEDKYLHSALLNYSRNILLISLLISLITAGLVFLSLYWMIVRPIIKLSGNMDEFSKHPENSALIYTPTGRKDEIGIAEDRLAALQSDLQDTLRQKQHLAELGLAVSKINHDLRNILASALLFSDRLSEISDPTVQRFAPKLVKTIERAVEYTRSVLAYGKAKESAPDLKKCDLNGILREVTETLEAEAGNNLKISQSVPENFALNCDREQMFRVLLNLSRNAVQAMADNEMAESENARNGQHLLDFSAINNANTTEIRVGDNGPGIPDHLRQNLFNAFQGSGKRGSTGLGLAIASELVRAHGGEIHLEKTDSNGSVFLIRLAAS